MLRHMDRHAGRRFVRSLLALLAVLGLALPAVVAAAGPPFPEPVDGQAVYDTAELFSPEARAQAESIIDAIEAQTKAEVVVYTQALGRDDITPEETEEHARALMDQWGVGRAGLDDGLVILFDLDTTLEHGQVQLYAGPGFSTSYMSQEERQAVYDDTMLPLLAEQQFDEALLGALAQIVNATFDGAPPESPGEPAGPVIDPGPPFPEPEIDRAVYDFAGIFSNDAIVRAEATIDAIETRTAAEVVVYTQLVDFGVSTEETEARARALIDQWGVGRRGFDDGLAIFFDIDPSLEHGQVQLYAAPGFEATYLTNADRQRIFDEDMVPHLREADFDAALDAAMRKVDAAATPENAARLQVARQFNAVLGLVGAPVVLLGLAGWAFLSWRRFGKDPVYLDDPSILMPAPPPDLTAASGAFMMDGGTSRRALTTAMLDLASRGQISFREDKGLLGISNKVGVDTEPTRGDEIEEAHRARNARRPIGPAEDYALRQLRGMAKSEGFIDPDELPEFGPKVAEFDSKLEDHVVKGGWMVEQPRKVIGRWMAKGIVAIVAGVVALFIGANVPISGLVIDRGRRHRRRGDHHVLRAEHAGGHDGRGDDPGHARGLPTHAPEDDGAGALDAAGGRPGWPLLAGDPGSGRRVGHGARVAERHRGRAATFDGGCQGAAEPRVDDVLPGLVSHLGWVVVRERHGRGQRRLDLLGFGGARCGRDDVGARHDRELAGVVEWRQRWRVRRRLVGRWRRRRRRRVLGACRRPGITAQRCYRRRSVSPSVALTASATRSTVGGTIPFLDHRLATNLPTCFVSSIVQR